MKPLKLVFKGKRQGGRVLWRNTPIIVRATTRSEAIKKARPRIKRPKGGGVWSVRSPTAKEKTAVNRNPKKWHGFRRKPGKRDSRKGYYGKKG